MNQLVIIAFILLTFKLYLYLLQNLNQKNLEEKKIII